MDPLRSPPQTVAQRFPPQHQADTRTLEQQLYDARAPNLGPNASGRANPAPTDMTMLDLLFRGLGSRLVPAATEGALGPTPMFMSPMPGRTVTAPLAADQNPLPFDFGR